MILGLDHVQLAMPAGGEDAARAFYSGHLQMEEIPKPEALAGRGGCWFAAGRAQVHLGVETGFAPARKAHPALLVGDLAELQRRLAAAGVPIAEDESGLSSRRLYTQDPFGNRLELIQDGEGFSQGV